MKWKNAAEKITTDLHLTTERDLRQPRMPSGRGGYSAGPKVRSRSPTVSTLLLNVLFSRLLQVQLFTVAFKIANRSTSSQLGFLTQFMFISNVCPILWIPRPYSITAVFYLFLLLFNYAIEGKP